MLHGGTKLSAINLLINGKHNHILLLSWLKKYDDDTDVLFSLFRNVPEICVIRRKLKQFIFYGEELITIWKTFSGKFNKPPTLFCMHACDVNVKVTTVKHRLLNKTYQSKWHQNFHKISEIIRSKLGSHCIKWMLFLYVNPSNTCCFA